MRLETLRGTTRSRASRIALIALAAGAFAAGMAGCSGDDGKTGATGPAGPGSTIPGPTGPTGATGPAGTVDVVASTKPESCSTCHANAATDQHQSVYNNYIDSQNKNLKLKLVSVTTSGAAPSYTVTMSFTIKNADGTPVLDGDTLPSFTGTSPNNGQRAFYITAYDSATKTFSKVASLSASKSAANCTPALAAAQTLTVCSSGVISDGLGAYHITATGFPYDPTVTSPGVTGTIAYAYVAKASALLVQYPGLNYRLYSDFADDAITFGDAGKSSPTTYVSTANVSACKTCHVGGDQTKPYLKHGYRAAQVANLTDFTACKVCHADNRVGSDHVWQQMLDDPYAWATGVAPDTAKYAYKANLMNDTHMSHAMEFGYPQSLSNCNTCHAGKLDTVLADKQFTATTCKSCHAVDGKDSWFKSVATPQKYAQATRAPALKDMWAAANVSFHNINDDCSVCHKTGGVGSTFKKYHSGYDASIYDAANGNKKYSTEYSVSVDSATFDKTKNTLNIKFSATNTATKPTVAVSFYGYDTKDFYISGHTGDGHVGTDAKTGCYSSRSGTWGGCTMEYAAGANLNDTTDATTTRDNNLLYTEVATGTPGKWDVTLDLTKYVQPASTKSPTTSSPTIGTIPALITSGTLKKVEIAILPSLTIGTQVAAISAVSKTFDLVGNAFASNYFQGTNAIADVAKCNNCHDTLGTTFHTPAYGGSVTVCRTCHVVTNGGAHLEMQSRSIDSYAHAIHASQYFDTNSVDFSDPVYKARYNLHVEGKFPNFMLQSCEGCHYSGKYGVPDQSKSMPSLLSGSYTMKNWDRNIGTVPAFATGAGGRACAGCHKAELINEDDAGDLASINSHIATNGILLDNTAPNSYLYGVIDKIMGYFK
jgi:OmcA/MtrC family decaheme c-type cytochrome